MTEKHQHTYDKNIELLKNSGIQFGIASDECYCIRETGRVPVDFNPYTGKWKIMDASQKIRSGGMPEFLQWYNKKKKKSEDKSLQRFERVGIYPPEEIFSLFKDIPQYPGTTITFQNCIIKNSVRYYLYLTKGIECVQCHLVGSYFALEKDISQQTPKHHFNLYALKDNKEIMITVDHIFPASKGGSKTVQNLQPMCFECNSLKGNKV